MRLIFQRYALMILTTALFVGTVLSGSALAHEHRHVGHFDMTVGWGDEPTFVGFKNGVQLILNEMEKPVLDLEDSLKVEVIYGTEKIGPLQLRRSFGKTYGTPGDYRATVIPTRAGTYTFHFVGAIKDTKVDESFTCSAKTFNCVEDTSELEFPAKDPSRAELAMRVERLTPRIEAVATEAQQGATTSRTLAIVGIVLGAGALVFTLWGGRKRA